MPPSADAGAANVDGGAAANAEATPTAEPPSRLEAPEEAKPPVDKSAGPKTLTELKARKVEQSVGGRLMGVLGCAVVLGLAFLLSVDRRRVPWRLVAMGTALQVLFALIVLKTSFGVAVFQTASDVVRKLMSFSTDGARFVFGNLVDPQVPVVSADGSLTGSFAKTGGFIAFGVMPSILFFSAVSAILYHLGILQRVVRVLAYVMRRTMGASGAESLAAAANIFLGQTESPILVRPFLPKMTRSELMAVMTGGFATVAGGVLAAYVGFLSGYFPDIAGHLLAASVMSAPASLVMAKIMVPETEVSGTADGANVSVETEDANFLDAAARGTSEGVKLALNVAAMLIAFMALLPMANWLLTLPAVPFEWLGFDGAAAFFSGLTLEKILGALLAPLAFLLGVPWEDAPAVGALMGTKTILNEFVAYLQLASALEQGTLQHGKSVIIATYALCGFSNIGSIGIQLGGLSVMAPSRRKDLAQLGLRAMIAASLACFQTAALAGMLL